MTAEQAIPRNGANRFAHIDAMRAFSVLIVVLAHAGLGWILPGGAGVTIFFSISGFIITTLLLREREKTGGFSAPSFYARRFWKIVPPLTVGVIIPTLIYSIWHQINWLAFAAQVFFFFNWFKASGGAEVLPGTGVVWSLSIEEQFYILFAVIWLIFVRTRHWQIALTCLSSAAIIYSMLSRVIFASSDSEVRIYYGSDTRLDGIAWGVMLAIIYRLWVAKGAKQGAASRIFGSDGALLVGLVLFLLSLIIRDEWFRDTLRFTLQSVAACLVIAYGQLPGYGGLRKWFYRLAQWRPVAMIGLASYSIYLVHLVVASALKPLVAPVPPPLRIAVLAIVGVAAGFALYYAVEIPVQRYRRARLTRS